MTASSERKFEPSRYGAFPPELTAVQPNLPLPPEHIAIYFAELVRNCPIAMLVLSPEHRVLLCNQSTNGSAVIDTLLRELEEAQRSGQWRASGASEQRRLDLLPTAQALDWEHLMVHPSYMRAMDLLP